MVPNRLGRPQQSRLLNAVSLFTRTHFCGAVKLFRLTYLLDVLHFQRTGVTVTGQTYHAYKFGPGPDHLFALLGDHYPRPPLDSILGVRGDESIDVFGKVLLPKVPPLRDDFTPMQVEIANSLLEQYSNAHWAAVDLSADNGAYEATWEHGRGHGRAIDIARTIAADDPYADYALERYREDQQHARALQTLFGNAA